MAGAHETHNPDNRPTNDHTHDSHALLRVTQEYVVKYILDEKTRKDPALQAQRVIDSLAYASSNLCIRDPWYDSW